MIHMDSIGKGGLLLRPGTNGSIDVRDAIDNFRTRGNLKELTPEEFETWKSPTATLYVDEDTLQSWSEIVDKGINHPDYVKSDMKYLMDKMGLTPTLSPHDFIGLQYALMVRLYQAAPVENPQNPFE